MAIRPVPDDELPARRTVKHTQNGVPAMPAQNIKRNLAAVASAAALGLGAAAVALSPGAAAPVPATASSISPQTWQSLGTRAGGEVVTLSLYSTGDLPSAAVAVSVHH